jgi:hypothetical protein
MEETPENGKELLYSAHGNGINQYFTYIIHHSSHRSMKKITKLMIYAIPVFVLFFMPQNTPSLDLQLQFISKKLIFLIGSCFPVYL